MRAGVSHGSDKPRKTRTNEPRNTRNTRTGNHARTSIVTALAAAVLVTAVPSARQAPAQPPPSQQPQAQQPPPPPGPAGAQQPQPPPIRTGINFVRVDVIISDRQGNPLLDLKQDEFRIKEDGKPQAIESFSVVKIDPAAQIDAPPPPEIRSVFDEQREAQRPDVRLFVILLDDYHVKRGNDMVVRKPIIDFLENRSRPPTWSPSCIR